MSDIRETGSVSTAARGSRNPWRVALDVAATTTMLAASVGILLALHAGRLSQSVQGAGGTKASATIPLPKALLSLEAAAVEGSAAARVAIIEFSDFQCPFCGRFVRDTLPQLQAEFIASGKARLAFRHLPIATIHPFAFPAARAAACADQQHAFWPMHDLLFKDQTHLDHATLRDHSVSLGLDQKSFDACLSATSASIESDIKLAKSLGISGTPAFIVGIVQPNGLVKPLYTLSGAQPTQAFEHAIADAIDKANSDGLR